MSAIRNRILILDLDSTLIHTDGDMAKYEKLHIFSDPKNFVLRDRTYTFKIVDVVDIEGTGTITPMWGVFRPHMKEFLSFALKYFSEVRIWSAGKFKYVHAITDIIFRGLDKPKNIKTYRDCKITGNRIYKCLSDYVTDKSIEDLSNCLILDDRKDTFELNINNGIEIPIYEPDSTYSSIMGDDIALLQFMAWLSLPVVNNSSNLASLSKNDIFSTPLDKYYQLLGESLPFDYNSKK